MFFGRKKIVSDVVAFGAKTTTTTKKSSTVSVYFWPLNLSNLIVLGVWQSKKAWKFIWRKYEECEDKKANTPKLDCNELWVKKNKQNKAQK